MKYYSEETVRKIIAHAEYNGTFCIRESINLGTYPSIELPDKHGRLKDADAIKKRIDDGIENMTRVGIVVDAQFLWDLINVALNEAPTIVEASNG